MLVRNRKPTIIFTLSAIFLTFFTSIAAADTLFKSDLQTVVTKIQFQSGTDSKGSYSFDKDTAPNPGQSAAPESQMKTPAASVDSARKTEGSKKKTHLQKKSEGSKGKSYSHKGKAYTHGKGHSYKGHGNSHKKGDANKGKTYSHGKKEGSKGKQYSQNHHGHKGKSYAHKKNEGSKNRGHGHKKHGSFHSKIDPFHHVFRFKHKLMLSEKQIDALKKHEFEYKKTEIQAKADKAIAHMELDRLVHSDTVDESAIRAVGQRLIQAKSKMINAKIEAKIAVLKILTQEQRKKVKTMHSRH